MKLIRKTLLLFLAFCVLLTLGIFLGSIDSSHYDDLGLLNKVQDVESSDNGFVEIAYTQQDDFVLIEDDSSFLRKHVYAEVWDEGFVKPSLTEASVHMNRAISSLKYPYFKFDESEDPVDLPSYLPIMGIARLLIIKSMHEAKKGNNKEAIVYAGYAIDFSQKVKTESNHWLISHMIGLVMQYEALIWVYRLAVESDLESKEYRELLTILERMPPYSQDKFSHVFSGELVFVSHTIDTIESRSFKERWLDYRDNQEWWDVNLDALDVEQLNAKEKLYDFLHVFFPKFYMHKNRMLNESSKYFSMMAREATNFCNEIMLPKAVKTNVEWSDLVVPNSLMRHWIGGPSYFNEYFSRRCFSHSLIEATKAVVGILMYKKDHNEYPPNLEMLVPEYLSSIPLDPFDGTDIKYMPAKGYIYSVGENFKDDGGAVDSHFVRQCGQSDLCANNPTFPLHSALPAKDGYCEESVSCESE